MKKRLLAAVLLLLSSAVTAEEAAHCRVIKLATLPIDFNRLQPTLQGRFNAADLLLVMDSGSVNTTLFPAGVQKAGLHERHANGMSEGVGGMVQDYIVTVDEVVIGPSQGKRVEFYETSTTSLDADGLLGADYLFRTDLELVLRDGKAVFVTPDHCGDEKPIAYWDPGADWARMRDMGPHDLRQIVEVKINGQSMTALLDTGAGRTVIDLQAAARIGLSPQSPGAERLADAHGVGEKRIAVWRARIQSFEIGTEAIQNTSVQIGDLWGAGKEDGHNYQMKLDDDHPDMLLGADFMRAHHLLFARSQRRLYLTYLGGPIFSVNASAAAPQTP